jgi:predicted SAM-dependent methyltransferase
MGNVIGGQRRAANLDLDVYVSRGDLLVELCRKYAIGQPGQRLLEIGTGWMHWFAIYLRLHFDVEIATLDVWDNRQFEALQAAFAKLQAAPAASGAPPQLRQNLRMLLDAKSFPELYERLNLSYVIQSEGSLEMFADASRDCVFSFHVLEHVPAANVNSLCAHIYRVLKPGGVSIHQIGIDDHLTHYDRTCSHKQYLAYSDRKWKWLFENTVQYFNRLQTSDWLTSFGAAGFILREKLAESTDIARLRIDPQYRRYSEEDLACTILTLVLQKPPTA